MRQARHLSLRGRRVDRCHETPGGGEPGETVAAHAERSPPVARDHGRTALGGQGLRQRCSPASSGSRAGESPFEAILGIEISPLRMPLASSSRVDDVTDVVDGSVGKRGGREELQRAVFVRLPVDWVDACDVDLEEQADPVAAGRWHAFDGVEKADVARCDADAGLLG